MTRLTSIGAFIKMIKTRFGDSLPHVEHFLRIKPFETSQRHLRTIPDYTTYKKIYSTLPAIALAAQKARVRSGEPKAIRDLWTSRDKTFLAIDFEASERNPATCLEWGFAAARCGFLDSQGAWPPDPEPNYRRGHYIVAEYVDKVHNKHRPNFPWAYAFGDSHQISKTKLPSIIQAVISSLATPDSETIPNGLVLVGHGISNDLRRLEDMKIKIPHNVLVIDTASYERMLFKTGQLGPMQDPSGKPRSEESTLSLANMLLSIGANVQCTMHNAGNDAFMTLLALQLLLEPENTKIPVIRGRNPHTATMIRNPSRSPAGLPTLAFPTMPMVNPYGMMLPSPLGTPSPTGGLYPPLSSSPILADSRPSSRTGSGATGGFPFPEDPRPRRISQLVPEDERRPSNTRRSSGGNPSTEQFTARMSNMRIASG